MATNTGPPPRALEDAVRRRKARQAGPEIRFQCPCPERHNRGDANPSARYHPEKGVWHCDVCGEGGGWVDLCRRLGVDLPARPEASRPRVVAQYDYRDEDGGLLRRKLRWEPGFNQRSKSFTWQKPDGAGGWTSCKGDGNPGFLYGSVHLPKAREQTATVLVVEGEKDCDSARQIGWVAVCNPEGASESHRKGKWRDHYSRQLEGLAVVVIADDDPPGRAHARSVARALDGTASATRYLELPGERVKDLSDWVDERRREGMDEAAIGEALEVVVRSATNASELSAGPPSLETDSEPDESHCDLEPLLASLRSATALEGIEPIVRSLALAAGTLDRLERGILREKAIAALQGKVSSPAALFDAALRNDNHETQAASGRRITLSNPAPWPEPVPGVALLDDIVGLFERFVALGPGAVETLALWVLFSYTYEQSEVSPILLIRSPEKRCGKTTLLTLLSQLVRRPLAASNITPAALFRTIEAQGPTLLIDEADTFLNQSDELRGVLNSGHTRATAFVVRTVGDDHEPRQFSTWGPKAVALIGRPPSTLEDRSLTISMRRKTAEETVERLRLDRLGLFEAYRSRIVRWANDHGASLHGGDPAVPSGLDDRAADNWRPLLALAEVAGPPWPERARNAAVQITDQPDGEDSSPGVTLLTDLKAIFSRRRVEVLSSQDLVNDLVELEDRPWPEWRRGKPLSAVQLARLLKPFGVRPRQVRVGAVKIRGYVRGDFEEPFRRYLPPESVHPVQPFRINDLGQSPTRYKPGTKEGSRQHLSTNVFNGVPGVPGHDPVQTAKTATKRRIVEL